VLLRNNGLHVELVFDRTHFIGAAIRRGLADVRLESAISAIMDCEDSVACVDAEDKVLAYRNWLGLMKGDLTATLRQGRQDRDPRWPPTGLHRARRRDIAVKGRALMLVRNVGHLMTNPAILRCDGARSSRG
jgi:malate synthase